VTISQIISQPASKPANYPWADDDGWKKWAPEGIVSKYDFSFDPDKANTHLDQMGSTREGDVRSLNGKPPQLTMICPMPTGNPMFQIGQTMADAAKGVGIQIDHKSLPGSAFWDTYAMGDYDISNHWLCGMDYHPIHVFGGLHSKNDKPIGTCVNSGGDQGSARFKNADLDKVLDQLDTISPDDAAAQPLCDKALDLSFTNLPSCPSIEQVAPMLYNTTYYTGCPTTEGQETIPASWWEASCSRSESRRRYKVFPPENGPMVLFLSDEYGMNVGPFSLVHGKKGTCAGRTDCSLSGLLV